MLALAATIIGMVVGFVQFVLNRVRIPRIRYIGHSHSIGLGMVESSTFTVDIVNWGASIHHLEVSLVVFVPPWVEADKNKIGTTSFDLWPVGTQPKTMETGDAQEFVFDASVLKNRRVVSGSDLMEHFREILEKLPRKYVSLHITCNGKRKTLRRIKSRQLHREVERFFDLRRRMPPNFRERLAGILFVFQHGKNFGPPRKSDRIRAAFDKWRPGYFDYRMEQLRDLLVGHKISPDRLRPHATEEELRRNNFRRGA